MELKQEQWTCLSFCIDSITDTDTSKLCVHDSSVVGALFGLWSELIGGGLELGAVPESEFRARVGKLETAGMELDCPATRNEGHNY